MFVVLFGITKTTNSSLSIEILKGENTSQKETEQIGGLLGFFWGVSIVS